MSSFDINAVNKIFTLMEKSHMGVSGGAVRGMKDAAHLAVDKYGVDWITPKRGAPNAVSIHKLMKLLVKLSCPPNSSNPDKYVSDFFRYAENYVSSLKPKLTASELLKQLE
jgi:hypothetical protein